MMKTMALRVLREDIGSDHWVLGIDDPNVQVIRQPLSQIIDQGGNGSTAFATVVVSEGVEVPSPEQL